VKLSIIYPCYCQQQTLLRHIQRWEALPGELKEQLDFVVVDDHSREPISVPDVELNLRLFRVNTGIIWNYGAKNLGIQKAHAPWIFLSELDHLLNEQVVRGMLQLLKLNDRFVAGSAYFMFNRAGKERPHPATYLLHSRDFWAVNGLDEDFCGAYGHDDTYLVACLEQQGLRKMVPEGIELECIMKDADYEDAELWRLDDVPRDTTRNDELLARKLKNSHISTGRVRFDWELINEYRFIR
jgi:hypothetical protein